MKYLIILFISISFVFSCSGQDDKLTTSTFKVNGVCEGCKRTMEEPLTKKKGVHYRNWDIESKVMEVKYDATKITLKEIYALINKTGYKIIE